MAKPWQGMDCGDGSCRFATNKSGMRTNGGCVCLETLYMKGRSDERTTAANLLLDSAEVWSWNPEVSEVLRRHSYRVGVGEEAISDETILTFEKLDNQRKDGRQLLRLVVKYAQEDGAITPRSTRLGRLLERVADYLRRTHNPSDILRSNEENETSHDSKSLP